MRTAQPCFTFRTASGEAPPAGTLVFLYRQQSLSLPVKPAAHSRHLRLIKAYIDLTTPKPKAPCPRWSLKRIDEILTKFWYGLLQAHRLATSNALT